MTRIPTLRFCYSSGQGAKIWTVKTLRYLVSPDQGSGKEKCSQWPWGQLIRNTGTIRLAFEIDPWMPLKGGEGVIQYKLSHLLLTLPETIYSNLKGTFETPMAPFQLKCALCLCTSALFSNTLCPKFHV